MKVPWKTVSPMPSDVMRDVRRRMMFEWHKWDHQCGDVNSMADVPVVLTSSAWKELRAAAERLAGEVMTAERELLERPALWKRLGIPWAIRRALKRATRDGAAAGVARVIRFDFHYTTEGWRISEANTDVPGGFNEATGLPEVAREHYPSTRPAGDPTEALVTALCACRNGSVDECVAMVHATAYSVDRQVMIHFARQFEQRGVRCRLVAPDQLTWDETGRACVESGEEPDRIFAMMRFYPAEWLCELPWGVDWKKYFAGSRTPSCNPGSALLTQSKRFPLVWPELSCDMATWRALLPETRDPRQTDWTRNGDWVLKPACGRVGEGIGMTGVTDAKEWKTIARSVKRWPIEWVAQRRFDAVPMQTTAGAYYPCIGVFTVDGRAAGAYGRLGKQPLINCYAQDAAVLVVEDEHNNGCDRAVQSMAGD